MNNNDSSNKDNEDDQYEDYMRTSTGCVDRFFDKYLFRFVTYFRIPLIILALIWLGLSAWRALTIKSVSYNEQFFNSNHPVQRFLDLQTNELFNDKSIYVKYYFGVHDTLSDPSKNVSRWDTTYNGVVSYLPTFDISSENAQQALLNFCQRLETFPLTYSDQLMEDELGPGQGKNGSVRCFI